MVNILNKLAEIESKLKLKKSNSNNNGAMSPTNSMTNTSTSSNALAITGGLNGKAEVGKGSSKVSQAKPYQEFLVFKPIKEHQIVSGPLSTHLYSRGGTNDYAELTFKLLK